MYIYIFFYSGIEYTVRASKPRLYIAGLLGISPTINNSSQVWDLKTNS